MVEYVDSGKREKVDLLGDGENWYFTYTPTSITATVPYENRPDRERDRLIVEKTCAHISTMMERFLAEEDSNVSS